MGQLIKLNDYISRYEMDTFHYPSQFIRLKRNQWENYLQAWEEGSWGIDPKEEDAYNFAFTKDEEENRHGKLLAKFKKIFSREERTSEDEKSLIYNSPSIPAGSDQFSLPNLWKKSVQPKTADELKMHFLEELFSTQLIWASSTLTHRSFIDSSFYKDEKLKYFLQRFPDTFLFFYKPIFLIKKAPVESETIMITPTGLSIIAFLEEEEQAVFIGSDEKFWEKRYEKEQKKLLNPMISINRTYTIIRQIIQAHDIDFPINKIIISRNGYIDYPSAPYGVTIVDRKSYSDWFESMRNLRSPLKHVQLKTSRALLDYCRSLAVKREEWGN